MIDLYLRRFFGFTADSLIIYLLIIITRFYVPFIYVAPFFCLLYSFISAAGLKTVGMKITKLQFGKDDQIYSKTKMFFREFIFKWVLFFLLPILIYLFLNIYNYISINHLMLILLVVFFFVNTVCLLISKRTLVDILSKTRVSKIEVKQSEFLPKIKSGNSFLAFMIDFFVIFSITILLFRILVKFVYIETIPLLFIVALGYGSICYFIKKQTLGKALVGITVVSKNSLHLSFRTILIREFVCKLLLRYLILFFVLFYFKVNDWIYIAVVTFIINIIIGGSYFIVKGEFWWDTIARTQKIKNSISKKEIVKNFITLVSIFSIVYIFLLCDNNLNHHATQNIAGFKYPFKKFEYPNNANIKPYSDYLKLNDLKNPKDYILGLFEDHDIVILCECIHDEDTQWELIYDIVSNDYFINHVGNIFTEYGCAKEQVKVNTFLHTTFENDALLEKETATLMNFRSCFYFFMKKLNKLNQNLADSLKIHEHFTDILSWRYLDGYYADSIIQHKNVTRVNRDSLMANVVIDWYRETGKKCLMVTNYRHAFAVNNKKKNENYYWTRFFSWNEGQYIYNQFPDKIANVYIFGFRHNYVYHEPVQKGKWKAAFKCNNYQPIGFNLAGTPFGYDNFDIVASFGRKITLKWQDLFTGLVFYKPEESWTFTDYPHQEYAVQQEYQWAVENNLLADTATVLKYMERYKKQENYKLIWSFLNLHDCIDILLFIIISVITFLVSGIFVLRWLISRT